MSSYWFKHSFTVALCKCTSKLFLATSKGVALEQDPKLLVQGSEDALSTAKPDFNQVC